MNRASQNLHLIGFFFVVVGVVVDVGVGGGGIIILYARYLLFIHLFVRLFICLNILIIKLIINMTRKGEGSESESYLASQDAKVYK